MSSCHHSAVPPRTGGRVPAAPFITVESAHLALTGTTGLEPPSKASNYAPNELDIGSDGMVYFRATDISGKAYWLMVPVGEQAVCLALLWSSIDPNKKRITLRAGPGKGDGPLASYGGDDDTNLASETDIKVIAAVFAMGPPVLEGRPEDVKLTIKGEPSRPTYTLSEMKTSSVKRAEVLSFAKKAGVYNDYLKKTCEDIYNEINRTSNESATAFNIYYAYLNGKKFGEVE
jgi:hypothetical protein